MSGNFLLYLSPFDEYIIYSFISLILFIFFIDKVLTRVNFSRNLKATKNIEKDVNLKNYTLNFNVEDSFLINNQLNEISIFSKIVVYGLSLLLVLIPFHELIETLKPVAYFFTGCY